MIKKLQKGSAPSLLDTNKGNEIIDAINALSNISIKRGASDSFHASDSNAIITLTEHPSSSQSGEEIDLYICLNEEAKIATFYIKEIKDIPATE